MNMYLIIMEGNCVAVDADDSTCHGYYIIEFSSSKYTLQADASTNSQFISYYEMVCEGIVLFPIDINYHYYF